MPPSPLLDAASLRSTMPSVAGFYRWAVELVGREHVVASIRAAIALRHAVEAEDVAQVEAIGRECRNRGIEPVHAVEGGVELGVSPDAVRAVTARPRAATPHHDRALQTRNSAGPSPTSPVPGNSNRTSRVFGEG
jgi:hypothetical protein